MNAITTQALGLLSRVRRNHALEHATIRVLGERHRGLKVVGRSSLWGFALYGDVETEEVLAAAQEGLRRLRAGQRQMAIHPNCGTNLAVSGVLAGLGAVLAFGGCRREREQSAPARWLELLSRFSLASTAATLGLLVAQPVGPLVQAHVTTQADVGGLRLVEIIREAHGGLVVHRVYTADGEA